MLWDGGRNGLILKGKKGALGSTFYGLTPLAIDSDYLFYYLKTKEELRKDTRHVENTFWEMEIPIPPIEEQKHIAQSIKATYQDFEAKNKEAEKNLVDSFKKLVPIQSATLDKIIGLEDFKKAILDLAVSGKLTEKWRLINNLSIKNENYPLSDLALQITDGEHITPKKLKKQNNNILISAKNIRDGYIDYTDVDYISDEAFVNASKRCSPQIGDILMVSVGATIGRCSIVVSSKKFIIVRSIALIRPNTKKLNNHFLFYQLKSPKLQNIIKHLATGNAQPSLYLNKINNIEIFVPSLEEQTEIVHIVETIFAEADKIQQDFELQKKQQDDLLKSVINAFFQYSNFPIAQTDWNLDAQIKEAREKKEKEIKLLKEKQMAKKKEEESKPKPDILSLLKESVTPMSANDLLEQSKFNGNIDDFFAEAKELDSKGVLKWEIDKETQNTEMPLSMLTLIEAKL